jgi:AcrR family transcriptional regulator
LVEIMLITFVVVGRRAMNRTRRTVAYATAHGSSSSTGARLDPRVRRTRQRLQEALLGLLREQAFDDITVQGITARAELSRVTFYLHYRDKDDLLTQIMKEALDALEAQVPRRERSAERVQQAIVRWFAHAAAYPELYHLVIGRNDRSSFVTQVRAHIEQIMAARDDERHGAGGGGVPLAIRRRFQAAACLSVIGWWLEQRMPYSPEEMAPWLWHLLEHGDSGEYSPRSARRVLVREQGRRDLIGSGRAEQRHPAP